MDLTAEGNSATFLLCMGLYTLDFAAVRKLDFRMWRRRWTMKSRRVNHGYCKVWPAIHARVVCGDLDDVVRKIKIPCSTGSKIAL